jgi:hypothetical protein
MPGFIGRQAELERLVETTQKRSASFIVVRGRRRIGKSRLIEEFAKGFANYYVFAGLPPEKHTTAKHQLDEFARQMARQFHTASSWIEENLLSSTGFVGRISY